MKKLLALSLAALLTDGCTTSVAPPVVKETVPVATLQQQKMCADQAKVSYDEFFRGPSVGLTIYNKGYTNHFDAATTTCYVEIIDSFSIDGGNTITTAKNVADAFEGRTYADYSWTSDKVKKYWEVSPTECSVKPRQGPEQECRSGDEFDALVLKYFGTSE